MPAVLETLVDPLVHYRKTFRRVLQYRTNGHDPRIFIGILSLEGVHIYTYMYICCKAYG